MRGRRGRHDGVSGLLRLAAAFRAARADQVLIMHHSASYALAARLAGNALGLWDRQQPQMAEPLAGSLAINLPAMSIRRSFRPLPRPMDLALINRTGAFSRRSRGAASAAELFDAHNIALLDPGGDGHAIIMGVGAMDVERQWPPTHFAALALGLPPRIQPSDHSADGAPSGTVDYRRRPG